MVTVNGNLDEEIAHRIHAGWINWKNISGLLCDHRIKIKIKGTLHKAVVKPRMMHGVLTWPVRKAQERKLDLAATRILRLMSGVTKMDEVRNTIIRGPRKFIARPKKKYSGMSTSNFAQTTMLLSLIHI